MKKIKIQNKDQYYLNINGTDKLIDEAIQNSNNKNVYIDSNNIEYNYMGYKIIKEISQEEFSIKFNSDTNEYLMYWFIFAIINMIILTILK